ncbi:hypothetical protein M378DRAFT_17009 [Amanita muscaria Koide BX008]|uniref:Fungal-type protein kinase domain-containing protein n=1 Tax=Amanita muscaria (strain Koide BX008) TaxID=946122 RepID=A0A0C2WIP9_AMAMK|nr:hypothetical protein M378DRAFT_17009 [Amanita muscaria Koide BX008]
MPIRSAIGVITNKIPSLPMYTAPSSSPEEKANVLEHAEVSGPTSVPLSHVADDKKAKTLVLAGLGRKLATFKSIKELLCVFADAADAHQQTLDKANILHRDVSAGNIVITDEGRGVLVDWDGVLAYLNAPAHFDFCRPDL